MADEKIKNRKYIRITARCTVFCTVLTRGMRYTCATHPDTGAKCINATFTTMNIDNGAHALASYAMFAAHEPLSDTFREYRVESVVHRDLNRTV